MSTLTTGNGKDIILVDTSSSTIKINGTTSSLGSINTITTGGGGDTVTINGAVAINFTITGGSGEDNFTGGLGNDNLSGGQGSDTLRGGAGNDSLMGGMGNDTLDGGAGIDTASYTDAGSSVTVDLRISAAQNLGSMGYDTLVSIENLIGSKYNDTLIGDGNANVLDGGDGNDNLQGNSGNDILKGGAGDDKLDGGTGNDTADYSSATSAVTLSLLTSANQNTGGAGKDTVVFVSGISTIENITGGSGNDVLTGDGQINVLTGNAGNDTLRGNGGDDLLIGGAGNDLLDGGTGNDTADYSSATSGVILSLLINTTQNTGGAGTDTIVFTSGGSPVSTIENIRGSTFNDTLTAGAAAGYLFGGGGNDTLTGNAGTIALYTGPLSHYTVTTLANGNVQILNIGNQDGDGTDTLIGISHVQFSDVTIIPGPIAVNDTASVTESGTPSGAVVSGNVLTNDSDPANYTLSVTTTGSMIGSYGTLVLNANGTWSYTTNESVPQGTPVAHDIFNYTLSNGHGGVASATLNIAVTGVNDAAVISGVSTGSVTEDGTLHAAGALTITDPDAGQAAFQAATNVVLPHGTFNLLANGQWTYDLNNASVQSLRATDSISDTFTAVSSDGTASQSITISIQGTNDIPVISGVSTGSVTEDGTLHAAGALAITDPDTAQAAFQAATNVALPHGTFNLLANGQWTYDLNNASVQSLRATDSISDTFTAVSLDGSASRSITVTIQGTSDLANSVHPVLDAVTEIGTPAGATITGNALMGASDPDTGSMLSISNTGTLVGQYGTLTLSADGSYSYLTNEIVDAGDVKHDIFQLTVLDGLGGSTNTNLNIAVTGVADLVANVHPVSADVTESGAPGGAVITGNVLTGDNDPDMGSVLSVLGAGTYVGQYGTLDINADGSYSYTTNESLVETSPVQTDTFQLTILDGLGTSTNTTLSINVTPAYDHPVVYDKFASVTESGTQGGTVPGGASVSGNVLTEAFNPDPGNVLSVNNAGTIIGQYGTLVLNADGSYTYTTSEILAAGVVAHDIFTYESIDSYQGISSATLDITVTGVADQPVLTSQIFVTESGTPIGAVLTGNVLYNPDQVVLSVTSNDPIAGLYGTLTINPDGSYTYTTNEILAAGAQADDVLNFTTLDGANNIAQGTLTIHVTGVNDAPVGSSSNTLQYLLSGGSLAANFFDLDQGDTLTYALTNPVAGLSVDSGTGAVSYSFAGQPYAFIADAVQVTDNHGALSNAVPLNLIFDPTYYTGGIQFASEGDLEATAANQILISQTSGITIKAGAGNDFILGTANDIASFGNLSIGISLTLDKAPDGTLTATGSDASVTKIFNISSFIGGMGSNSLVHGSTTSPVTFTVSGASGSVLSSDSLINDTFSGFQSFVGNAGATDALVLSGATAPVTFAFNGAAGTAIASDSSLNDSFSNIKIITDNNTGAAGDNAIFTGASSPVNYALAGLQAVVTGGGLNETLNNIQILTDNNVSSDLFSVGLGTWNITGDAGLTDRMNVTGATSGVTFILHGTSGTAIGDGHNDTFSNIQTITDSDTTNDTFIVGPGSWNLTGNAAATDTLILAATTPVTFSFTGTGGTIIGGGINDTFNNMKVITDNNTMAALDTAVFSGASSAETFTLGTSAVMSGGGLAYAVTLNNVHTLVDNNNFNDIFNVSTGIWNVTGSAGHTETINFSNAATVTLGTGNYTINGSAGTTSDILSFAGATGGVTINLATGSASGGGISATLSNIEKVIGTIGNDTLIAKSSASFLYGGDGNDILNGNANTVAVYSGTADLYTFLTAGTNVIGIMKPDGSTDTLSGISQFEFGGFTGPIINHIVASPDSTVVGGNTSGQNNLIIGNALNTEIIGDATSVTLSAPTATQTFVSSNIYAGDSVTSVTGSVETITITASVTNLTLGGNTILGGAVSNDLIGSVGTLSTTVLADSTISSTTTTFGGNVISSSGDPYMIGAVGTSNFATDSGSSYNFNTITFGANTLTQTLPATGAPPTAILYGNGQILSLTAGTSGATALASMSANTFNFGANKLTTVDTGATPRTTSTVINGVTTPNNFTMSTVAGGNFTSTTVLSLADTLIGNLQSFVTSISGGTTAPSTSNFNNNVFRFAQNATNILSAGSGTDLLIGNIQNMSITLNNSTLAAGVTQGNQYIFGNNSLTTTDINQTNENNITGFIFGTQNFNGQTGTQIGSNNLYSYTHLIKDVLIGNIQTFSYTMNVAGTVTTNSFGVGFTFGANSLTAGHGDDLLIGAVQTLNITVAGGAFTNNFAFGANTLVAGNGNNILIGDIQTLNISETGGAANSTGMSFANNTLTAGNGSNILIGNIGLFAINLNSAGIGNPTYAFGSNTLTAGSIASTGNNTLIGAIGTWDIQLTNNATINPLVFFNFGANTLTVQGSGTAVLVGDIGTWNIFQTTGGSFNPTAINFGNNVLTGGSGPTTMYGNIQSFSTGASVGVIGYNLSFGNNTLIAGTGNTTMYGTMVGTPIPVAQFLVTHVGVNDLRVGTGTGSTYTLFGGYGVNYADFIKATSGVTATLATQTGQNLSASGLGTVFLNPGNTLNVMQGLMGSDFADTLAVGNLAGITYLYGGKLNDNLTDTTSVAAGARTVFVYSGAATDYIYALSGTGITVTDTIASRDAVDQLNGLTFGTTTNGSQLQFGGIYGTTLYNLIQGTVANDSLTIGTGNKILFSNGGTDTAVFSGNLSQYSVVGTSLVDTRAGSPNGTTILNDVSFAQFADQTARLSFQTFGNEVFGAPDGFFLIQYVDNSPFNGGSADTDRSYAANFLLVLGDNNNIIYGNYRSYAATVKGLGTGTGTISTYNSEFLTFGSNKITTGNGDNTLIGQVGTFSYTETVGIANAASTTTVNNYVNVTFTSNFSLLNPAGVLLSSTTLNAGYGNNILIGHSQTFNYNITGGDVKAYNDHFAQAISAIDSTPNLTFNGGTLNARFGTSGGSHSPNGEQLYGDVQTFNWAIKTSAFIGLGTPTVNENLPRMESIIKVFNGTLKFGNDILNAGSDTINAATAAPDLLVGDVKSFTLSFPIGVLTNVQAEINTGAISSTVYVNNNTIIFGNDILNAGNRPTTMIGDVNLFSFNPSNLNLDANDIKVTSNTIQLGSNTLNGGSGTTTMYGSSTDMSQFKSFLDANTRSPNHLTLGNNTLTAGSGNTTMWGYGPNLALLPLSQVTFGTNTFIFNSNAGGMGADTIGDFSPGKDVIQLTGTGSLTNITNNINLTGLGGFVDLHFSNGGSVILNNVIYTGQTALTHLNGVYINALNNISNATFTYTLSPTFYQSTDVFNNNIASSTYTQTTASNGYIPSFSLLAQQGLAVSANGDIIGGINGNGNVFNFVSNGNAGAYGDVQSFVLSVAANGRIASFGTSGYGHGNIFNFGANNMSGTGTIFGNIDQANLIVTGVNSYMFTDFFNFASNTINTGSGADTLYGNIKDLSWAVTNGGTVGVFDINTLTFAGNTLSSGSGADTLYGNSRALNLTSGDSLQTSFSKFNNTTFNFGGNTLTTNSTSGVTSTLVGSVGGLALAVKGGTGTGDAHGEMNSNIFTFGSNTLTGGAGNDTLYGDMQTFSFLATPGTTGTGNLTATATDNRITFANNKLYGGAGNDTLYGTMLNLASLAAFISASGTNTVVLGNNYLVGGPGNDTLYGYGQGLPTSAQITKGSNTFVFDIVNAGVMGDDTIGDFNTSKDYLLFTGTIGLADVNARIVAGSGGVTSGVGGAVDVHFTNGGSLTFSNILYTSTQGTNLAATHNFSSLTNNVISPFSGYVDASFADFSNQTVSYSSSLLSTLSIIGLDAESGHRIGGINGNGNTFTFASTTGFGTDTHYGDAPLFSITVGANSRVASWGASGLGHGNIFNFGANTIGGDGTIAGNFITADFEVNGTASYMFTDSFNFGSNTINAGNGSDIIDGNINMFSWAATNSATIGKYDTNTLTFAATHITAGRGLDHIDGNIGTLSLTSDTSSIFNNTTFSFGANTVAAGGYAGLAAGNNPYNAVHVVGNIGTLNMTIDHGATMSYDTFTFAGNTVTDTTTSTLGNYALIGNIEHLNFSIGQVQTGTDPLGNPIYSPNGTANHDAINFGHNTLVGTAPATVQLGGFGDALYGNMWDIHELDPFLGADPTNTVTMGGNTFITNTSNSVMFGLGGNDVGFFNVTPLIAYGQVVKSTQQQEDGYTNQGWHFFYTAAPTYAGSVYALATYTPVGATVQPNTFVFNLAAGKMGEDGIVDFNRAQDILEFHGVPQTHGTTAAAEVLNINDLISSIDVGPGFDSFFHNATNGVLDALDFGGVTVHFNNGGILYFGDIAYTGQTSIGQLVDVSTQLHVFAT